MGLARLSPGEALHQLAVTRDRRLEWPLGREPGHHVGDVRHAWASGSWAISAQLLGEPLPALPDGPSHTQIGGDLLSQALAGQVPSALRGLTALFGMGRGVSPSLWPPKGCETGGPPPSPQNRTADRLKAGIKISVKPSKH